jgi:hypothetical protein
MDPSCGNCTSSDCRQNPGFTDPNCSEHGTKAQERREAELDARVAVLRTRYLRKLVRQPRKRRSIGVGLPPLWLHATPADKAPELIRGHSESMIYLAQQGRRRALLFSWNIGKTVAKPEQTLLGAEKLVYQHFRTRVRIIFHEVWHDHLDGQYEAWAVW